MKNFDIEKQKIIFSMILSFLAVFLMANTMFLANTPRINPAFVAKLKSIPATIALFPGKMIASLMSSQKPSNYLNPNTNINDTTQTAGVPQNFQKQLTTLPAVKTPTNVVFKSVTKGVYAAEDPITKSKYVTINKGTEIMIRNYTLTMPDGTKKQVQLYIPIAK